MVYDQNKKMLRSFQCRDYLWELFEQMSEELECSVDYLINEAMRQYARSRNYGVRTSSIPQARPSQPGIPAVPPSSPGTSASPSRSAPIPSLGSASTSRPSIPSAPPPPPPRSSHPSSGGGYYAPPPSAGAPPVAPPPDYAGAYGHPQPPRAPAPGVGYEHGGSAGQSAPPGPGYAAPQPGPPPLPQAPPPQAPLPPAQPAQPQVAARPNLYVIFNGQKIPVSKEEFIIGRGTKTADLPIKDGNISRRHAAVVYHGGAYYIKDLGSTNGVEFAGKRVGTKRIDEGDTFQICDYELRFTYY